MARKSIPEDSFLANIEIMDRLGGGHFGEVMPLNRCFYFFFFFHLLFENTFEQQVFRGMWNETTSVALKTVRNVEWLEELKREAKLMQ
jgi:hypothetical protein